MFEGIYVGLEGKSTAHRQSKYPWNAENRQLTICSLQVTENSLRLKLIDSIIYIDLTRFTPIYTQLCLNMFEFLSLSEY